ncbi:MAG: TdeIII family type II restriction endonuclease [Candidatus Marinimicrobia bacterium]|nr:TdeIII family type II restriction endonuclease [Candidatus Neomarinimicrobiota bacterium]
MINDLKKEKISLEVIRTLISRFKQFPKAVGEDRNKLYYKIFLTSFSTNFDENNIENSLDISLSSWLHGLNTSLGQSFFENIAHILSDGEKRSFNNEKILNKQSHNIASIMTELKNGEHLPNIARENNLIFNIKDATNKNATNFTADVYYEEDDFIEAIELKTVRPNSGEMKGEKQKILNGKAVLKNLHPDKNIYYYIGFPFDPFADSDFEYDKEKFKSNIIELEKYFDSDEILLSEELWDHLSGQKDTMKQIIDIINNIATENFMDSYLFVKDHKNYYKNNDKYIEILQKWNLKRELEIIKNIEKIISVCDKNKRLKRKLNQYIFDANDYYKVKRYNQLVSTVKN